MIMNITWMRVLMSVALCVPVLASASASASADRAPPNTTQTRDFTFHQRVTETTVETNLHRLDLFSVDVSFDRHVLRVNEDFDFQVRGNQAFFLYVFYIDKRSNQAVLVFPTADQRNNRYAPGKQYRVPQSGFFYADEPGMEQVIVVASQQYFDWNTQGYTRLNGLLATDIASFDGQVRALHYRPETNKVNAAMPQGGTAQHSRMNAVSLVGNIPHDIVVKRVQLHIAAEQQPMVSAGRFASHTKSILPPQVPVSNYALD